jgi:3-oxoacyl-[acyl-carrier protein] reductase
MTKTSEILITGANGGLGRSLVKSFSRSGFNVVAVTRELEPQFVEWCKELEETTGHKVINELLNLEDASQAQAKAREIVDRNPDLDHFINNAAIAFGSLILMTPLSSLRKVYEVNLISQFCITQVFVKHLVRKKHGKITNISSVTANIPLPGTFAYGSSKIALEYLTKVMALELADTGIVVNGIELGLVQTKMLEKMDEKSRNLLVSEDYNLTILEPDFVANKIVENIMRLSSKTSGSIVRI